MAQRKPYNPNTKYGRKKLREQAQQYYNNLSPEEQGEYDSTKLVVTIIIVALVCGVLYLAGGGGAVLKWLQR